MHGRLERRLARAGIGGDARTSILSAHAASVMRRVEVLGDDEHFEALHPSRTLLILLDDCGVTEPRMLEAAATVESEHAPLRVPGANDLADRVPLPGDGDDLAERLIVAEHEARLIALAERLDHARHLHLRDRADWIAFHALIEDVYAPIAARSHPRLGRRYDWWRRMFARRFLARNRS